MQDDPRHDAPKEVQADAQQPVELPTTEQKQDGQVNAPEAQAPVQGELPEEAKERTREQFEKLKAHNAELAKKLSQYEQPAKKQSIFDLTPQARPVPQVAPQAPAPQVQEIKPVVPDAEGYVDLNAINATIQQLNERALRQAEEAKQIAQTANDNISRFEIKQTSQEVFKKHPELDPDNTSFDDKLTHFVKLELLRQMTEEGTQDYMKAADFVKTNLYQPQGKKQGSEEARKAREEISTFTPQSSSSQVSDDVLRAGTLKGDRDAIYERLKRSGY